jgi:4-amino-4-deoxy-L-arabinose transferase-like glycosyltransferase
MTKMSPENAKFSIANSANLSNTNPSARWWWLMMLGLAVGCLVMRVIGLMDLPIFGDESIYLRWAQVIRGEGLTGAHWWVSLSDPKPPLHFWLIALVFHWAEDPLVAARMISVGAGVVCVPLMMAIGEECGYLMKFRPKQATGRMVGVVAAVLGVFCPFLAFYQRLATADALFVAESVLIVWLSLRWARLTVLGGKGSGGLTAALLGVAIGVGLMTRQGLSYTICAMPVAAWLAVLSGALSERWKKRGEGQTMERALWGRGLGQLFLAGVVALAMWLPYLTAELYERAKATNVRFEKDPTAQVGWEDVKTEIRRRVMYQESFRQAAGAQGAMMARNATATFVPGWVTEVDAKGALPPLSERLYQGLRQAVFNEKPNSGWLPAYMTPLVFGICLAGMIYAAVRQPRVFVLLLLWAVVMLGPIVLMVENIFSRYVLAGVPALLFAGALLVADTLALMGVGRVSLVGMRDEFGLGEKPTIRPVAWYRRALGVLGTGVLGMVVLAVPAWELWKQDFRWAEQTLTWWGEKMPRADRYQYLTGWTAGYGTRDAVAYLRGLARSDPHKPMVVITTNGWGTPADAVWVYLAQEPNVQLYFTDERRILRPGKEKGTYLLKADKWLYPPEQAVKLPEGAAVYFVCNEPIHTATKDVLALPWYREVNPGLGVPKLFLGIKDGKERGEGVAVFKVGR